MFPEKEFEDGIRKGLRDRVADSFDVLISNVRGKPKNKEKALRVFTKTLKAAQVSFHEAMKIIEEGDNS